MKPMRVIGKKMKKEQRLSSEDITWLVVMAQAILRAFVWEEGRPMRELAGTLNISPTTFYALLRLAIEALMWVRRFKASVDALASQVWELEVRVARVTQACTAAQVQVSTRSQALDNACETITSLQDQIACLKTQWTVRQDRLIVVLKMSGRCTVRRIVEVLEYGLGLSVSVGDVQGVIAQAGKHAHPLLARLLEVVRISGAICIDEVFLKEMGTRRWGVVIVDPVSGLILCRERCRERRKDALEEVITAFAEAGFKDRISLCFTDMYAGYLEPVKTSFSKAVPQFCWFHLNCFHIGATVYRAKRGYERAVKPFEAFDKKPLGTLSDPEQQQRQACVAARDLAQRYGQGAQRFQRVLMRLLWSSTLADATRRLDQLLRVAPRVQNPFIQKMGAFLAQHREGLLAFYACLESTPHGLQRLSTSRQQWVSVTKRWAVPIPPNAAEHVFRCLRRYTRSMDHVGSNAAPERFFDVFAFFHNVHILRAGKRAGNSLLASAHIDVIQLFGTDDPYTILGFAPTSQTFFVEKSVQAINE